MKARVLAACAACLCLALDFSAAAEEYRRSTSAILPQNPLVVPHPLKGRIDAFLKDKIKSRPRSLDVRDSKDYLRIIDGQIAVFRKMQDTNGAIIDPDMKIEWQYSTPCYALSVALLNATGYNIDPGLKESGLRAMDLAVTQMNEYRCAHNHGEFYLQPVMLALDLYARSAAPSKLTEWRSKIASIDPYKLHPDNLNRKKTVYNHNVVALAGEFLRMKAGVAADTNFFYRHLENQKQYFTDCGMYKDPNVPMVYDEFSRQFVTTILCEDTSPSLLSKADSDFYKDKLWRGAWSSLFMQSPFGECPVGGRSAQHIWNEAQMCVTYEIYAAQCARERSDPRMASAAGAFKRAAHLSLQSVQDWLRPDGSGYVVKNRFPIEARHGFERYSAQSQYNLLACWLMAVAYLYSDDAIPEGVAPSEAGGFVIPLVADFHKVFANAGGNYVEYDTSGQSHYNPTGLLRVHLRGSLPELGPSDGVVHKFDPKTKADLGGENLCIGPAWKGNNGEWHRLADYSPTNPPTVRVIKQSPDRAEFQVVYEGNFDGVRRISEHVRVSREGVWVQDIIDDSKEMRIYYPMLIFDGLEESKVDVRSQTARVELRGRAVRFRIESGAASDLRTEGSKLDFRNGVAKAVYAEIHGNKASYSISAD